MNPAALNDYFARIGYDGPRTADIEVLKAIHRLHPSAIPFETVDPFLGRTEPLDPDRIFDKLVRSGRGGWCFEHNLLLKAVLDLLGFETRLLAGRVMLNQPEGKVLPRHHMLLGVTHGSDVYIADVGFGGLTLTAPVLLKAGIEQQTPHEPVRINESPRGYLIEVDLGDRWAGLYSFELHDEVLQDFETANFYLAHCPDSLFRTGLMAAKAGEGYRLTLRGNRLTRRSKDRGVEVREVHDPSEIVHLLAAEFGLELTDDHVGRLKARLSS